MDKLQVLGLEKVGPLRKKTFLFALRMVKLYHFLTAEKKEYVMSKQLLRAGTNPGAMVREADNAESPADFIHKLSIGQKEIAETQYWLEFLYASDFLNLKEFQSLHSDATEILKMLRSSILTKKQNRKKNKNS